MVDNNTRYDSLSTKRYKELLTLTPVLEECGINEKDVVFRESPDFAFNYEGQTIGVEIEDCIIPFGGKKEYNHRRVEGDRDSAATEYQKRLIERGELHTRITITPTLISHPLKIKKNDFIQLFIEEVERHRRTDEIYNAWFYEHNPQYYTKFCELEEQGGFDYKYVESIDVFICEDLPTAVCCKKVYYLTPIKEQDFLPSILKKERKLEKYEKMMDVADEFWLVIGVPPTELKSIDDYIQIETINSGYSRIYLTQPQRCVRVK